MSHTSKKRPSVGNNAFAPPPARRSRRIAGRLTADFDQLDDVLANILEFLPLNEIMCNRRVSKKWGELIKMVVPHGDFRVNGIKSYNFIGVMTRAMPNLQQITLSNLNEMRRLHENWHKYSDGEDPNEEWAAETVGMTTHDIGIISNFRKLRILTIKDGMNYSSSLLNGSYPFLFNSFPLLQKLRIENENCKHLKWDLGMLSGFPLLKELNVSSNQRLTGNIRNLRVMKDTLETLSIVSCTNIEGNLMDLRVLKDTLETLTIASCANIEGSLMDLADFPLLNELNLFNTAVTGDMRDIGEDDFTNLEQLRCPFGVVGGNGYEFQRIADVPSVVNAYYRLKRRAKSLGEDSHIYHSWTLSEQSPDYYAPREEALHPPHLISFVEIGSRLGWRWRSFCHSCEINWLDPEPDRENDGYQAYVETLEHITQKSINIYRGYHQPPTEEEYRRLCREYTSNSGSSL